ncbi:hypothetical protein Tco_0341294 [Tanacetum coccineum]
MSDSEHSTMSYTSISLYLTHHTHGAFPLMDADEVPKMDLYEESRRRIPEEIPRKDPMTMLLNADDEEDEEEESFKDDDDKEEEHLAPADSNAVASPAIRPVPSIEETKPFETDESAATPPPPPAYRNTLRMSVRSQAPISFPSEEEVARLLTLPTPPPSPLTLLSSPLPQIPSPLLLVPSPLTTSPTYIEVPLGYRAARIRLRAASPPLLLPSTSRRADIPEANIPPRKRLLLTAPTPRFEVGESSAPTARQPGSIMACRVDYSFLDTVDASIRALERRTMTAIEMVNLRVSYQAQVDTLRRHLSSLYTTHEQERVEARQALARSEAYNKALEACITLLETQAHCHEWQCLDVDDCATGHIICIQPKEWLMLWLSEQFKETLTSMAMEDKVLEVVLQDLCALLMSAPTSVFHISNYAVENQVKFATCTLHVKTVRHDAAYGMPWKTLIKMMTTKYCLPNEIKKLEIEIWNLKSDKGEKYIGGLPNMIQGSVMASKPKEMHDAIEFATELMDQKIHTLAERQVENKRKFEDKQKQ